MGSFGPEKFVGSFKTGERFLLRFLLVINFDRFDDEFDRNFQSDDLSIPDSNSSFLLGLHFLRLFFRLLQNNDVISYSICPMCPPLSKVFSITVYSL